MRKYKPKNYVTGRWVLTIKTDKQGNFLGAKARWVLRGFQDKQKDYLETDSPSSTRPGFRMSCQMAANKSWDLFHIVLKTTFLQGQSNDVNRDVVCQLPLKKPAYGMNYVEHSGLVVVGWLGRGHYRTSLRTPRAVAQAQSLELFLSLPPWPCSWRDALCNQVCCRGRGWQAITPRCPGCPL